jgi:soluble lytic murein transglycosylase-like protein
MTRGLLDESPAGGEDYFPSLHVPVNSSVPGINEVFQPLPGRNIDTPIRAFDQSLQEGQAVESSSTPAPPTLDDIIDRAASRYGVDQELIRAVIRTESSFDPDAISPVGAQGLMQLMPETAKELGVSNPLDAEQNVMGGTRYLRQLLDRYDGDLDRALAAYNWGMGNVERRGMEQMPQETRDYLAKVKKAGNLA